MSLTTSEMTPADIAACTGNCNNGYNDGMFGGNGAWWLIILLLFGWGRNGFGGFGGSDGASAALTRGELCQDMNFQSLENATRGIQQGLCDGFYAVNTSLLNGFHGVDNAICTLGYQSAQHASALQSQIADCCCGVQRAIDGVNYNMATNTCALQNTMNNNTRDIIDNQNAGTRAILDYLCQDKISTLQSENNALRLAASQSNQNAVLMAAMDANKAEILRRTGNDCPVPAYVVQPSTPVTFATNCSGQATFGNNYGYNNGCGCGCGCNNNF